MNDYEKISAIQILQDQSGVAKLLKRTNELESKLAWAESLLKRAKRICKTIEIQDARGPDPGRWLADLEKGFEGEK